jgi:L-fucose/D-arabinose isomerase
MRNRLKGKLPIVRGRPVIDARERDVCKSVEDHKLNMATTASCLNENNLRFPSGEKVECIISKITIGGIVGAVRYTDQYESEGGCVSFYVTSAWCYGSEVMNLDPLIPKTIWGFSGSECLSALCLAIALVKPPNKRLDLKIQCL